MAPHIKMDMLLSSTPQEQQTSQVMRRSSSNPSLMEKEKMKQPQSVSTKDIFKKSMQMLYVNPEGSHIEGVEPHVKLDLMVGISCLSFALLAVFYGMMGRYAICAVVSVVTVTSVLSDAVFHGCTTLDLIDRYVATATALVVGYDCFRWMWEKPVELSVWVVALPTQVFLCIVPLCFLAKSRSCLIGSEEWRYAHSLWHIMAGVCCVTASALSHFCWNS
mmetsp:Transcript_23263/g.75653  ORF Transcript_23263/g.75653 Transcript_23263/m.75653 type:complete len:219 (-) Transcript_23263:61-717(-)